MKNEIVAHNDLKVRIDKEFFDSNESNILLKKLIANLPWESMMIKMFGKNTKIPRLQCWIGDEGCDYKYSGKKLNRQNWTKDLAMIREKISRELKIDFNSVLVNYYRDGKDSMGWHSDDEKELGHNPVIASVSLGAERAFHLKHKKIKTLKHKLNLQNGSLLLMKNETQHHWLHQIPKTKKPLGKRINLTFRLIK